MTIRFRSESRPSPRRVRGLQYYDWRIFADEPPDRLASVAEVEYVLHPTFSEPVQVRTDPATRFELASSGWGEFEVGIRVTYRDGSTEDLSHYLALGDEGNEEQSMYTVQPGDTLGKIAARFGVSPQALIEENELTSPHHFGIGQVLRIPRER